MGEACHMPDADGVGMGGEDDGDRFGRLPGGFDKGRRRREDDVNIHADQLGRELRQLLHPFRPSKLNYDVLVLEVAKVAQARPQCLHPARGSSRGGGTQKTDQSELRLLCTHSQRPRRHTAEQRDERTAGHSITSSASASRVGGMSMPSAFAVCRLMMKLNLLACMTGNSAGFSPLRIRPV